MLTIPIDGLTVAYLDLVRVALSEETPELRQRAISNVKHEVLGEMLSLNAKQNDGANFKGADQGELMHWMAQTNADRTEAALEFFETGRRFEERNQRKLNIAEHIGTLVFLTIQDRKFHGLHSRNGLLEKVRHEAKQHGVSGARDKDTVRDIWRTYKGVVHLGMAINYCEENPQQGPHVLHLAERFRGQLCGYCPRGTKKPYVDETKQLKFLYISSLLGPRFRYRGLPPEAE